MGLEHTGDCIRVIADRRRDYWFDFLSNIKLPAASVTAHSDRSSNSVSYTNSRTRTSSNTRTGSNTKTRNASNSSEETAGA